MRSLYNSLINLACSMQTVLQELEGVMFLYGPRSPHAVLLKLSFKESTISKPIS